MGFGGGGGVGEGGLVEGVEHKINELKASSEHIKKPI